MNFRGVTTEDAYGNKTNRAGDGYIEFCGAEWLKLDADPDTPSLTRAQYAALIRKALKEAWGDYDPRQVKLSVRTKNYAGGGSITITIEEIADLWRYDYRDDVKVREQVRGIASQWQRKSEHGQSDYLWSNFLLFVDYAGDLEDTIYNLGERPEVTCDDYRHQAQANYADDDIEIGDDADVDLTDDGAWIQARVWVPLSDFATFNRDEKEPGQVGPWAPPKKYGDEPIWNPTGKKLDRGDD